jgi:hypothetical protein
MWRLARIEGCFAQDEPVPLSLSFLLEFGPLHGRLTMPNGNVVDCFVIVLRQSDFDSTAVKTASFYAPDWLSLCLSLNALGEFDSRVGYFPLGEQEHSLEWRLPLDAWLARIAIQIYATARFRLGLIGYDASLEERSDDLMVNGLPASRGLGYLWPDGGGVRYYPAMQGNDADWWRRNSRNRSDVIVFRSARSRSRWGFRLRLHNYLNQLERRLEGWLRERSK